MTPCSDDVRQMTNESLAPFHRNLMRLSRQQRQHESSRNPLSSSGATDRRVKVKRLQYNRIHSSHSGEIDL
ncbi:unnamed protein product [Protopolystoma xenopodis]|uniref:Uncharacterized protein n=1 Tax=Protopolystoma xenopodis TaxID=117903 RepID=A0A448X0Y9_9PLAT|nr:unnamed protein product [Protopolystoma xenopodis]